MSRVALWANHSQHDVGNRMDKLGATPEEATAVMVDLAAPGVANGPEDLLDWDGRRVAVV